MPGTDVSVSTISGPPAASAPRESVAYIAALCERGPTLTSPHGVSVDGVTRNLPYAELTNLGDFARVCGTPQPYGWGYHAAKVFFEEGGTLMRLTRVVGGAATKGTATLMDRAGTPVATLRLDAIDEGAWSATLDWQVRAGLIANTFDLLILLGGTVVETYLGLTSPANAQAAITGTSAYVTATALSDATAAPNNNPAVAGPTALSAGTDDRGSLVPGDYLDAINGAFPPELGSGVVALPGFSAAQVGAGLKAHGQANGRNFYTAPPVGTDLADVQPLVVAQLDKDAGGEFGRFVWPWTTYTDDSGIGYTVPPEPYAMAGRCRAIAAAGVWQADAGSITRARFIDGVEVIVGKADGDNLDAAHCSVIRVFAGKPEVYGMRSLSTDDAWALFKFRDLVNKVQADLPVITHDLEFGTIDGAGQYFSRLKAVITAYLAPIAAAGGLYPKIDPTDGTVLDPGYTIDTSATVNPPQQLLRRIASADVMIRPSESANEIHIGLTKAAITA